MLANRTLLWKNMSIIGELSVFSIIITLKPEESETIRLLTIRRNAETLHPERKSDYFIITLQCMLKKKV